MPGILFVCRSKCPDFKDEEMKAQKGEATSWRSHSWLGQNQGYVRGSLPASKIQRDLYEISVLPWYVKVTLNFIIV